MSKQRNRKPYRTIRVTDHSAPHGVDPRLIFEVYPNGVIYVREHGRRVRRETTAASLYVKLIMRDVFNARMEKSRRKKKNLTR